MANFYYLRIVDNLLDILKQPIIDLHNRFILDLIHKNNKLLPEPSSGFYYDGSLYKEPGSLLKTYEAPELDESLVQEFNSIMQSREESLEYVESLKKELFDCENQFNSFCQSCFTKPEAECSYPQIVWAVKNFLPQELTTVDLDIKKYCGIAYLCTLEMLKAPLEDFGKKIKLSEKASNALNYLLGLQLL